MLLVCIFIIIILGIITVKRPRTIIWMGRYIRNKLLLLLIYQILKAGIKSTRRLTYVSLKYSYSLHAVQTCMC